MGIGVKKKLGTDFYKIKNKHRDGSITTAEIKVKAIRKL